jgi:hypothetical protein
VRKRITTWYRSVLESALGKVITVRFLVDELNANHQNVSVKGILTIVEEYHGEGSEFGLGIIGDGGGLKTVQNDDIESEGRHEDVESRGGGRATSKSFRRIASHLRYSLPALLKP